MSSVLSGVVMRRPVYSDECDLLVWALGQLSAQTGSDLHNHAHGAHKA